MPSLPSRSARLLHADEEQLDRAAIMLRGGTAFVVAMCPAALRRAALERLRRGVRGLTLPDPVEVGSPEESMVALVEQVERRDRVLSLVLGRDVEGALDGLNLHREKVVRGGPVILWLEDVATLVKMRERAPDAFSFRSTMAIVKGDGGPLPIPKGEEPERVMRLRKRLKRARTPLDRAAASLELATILANEGVAFVEAKRILRGALFDFPHANTEDGVILHADLCVMLAMLALMATGKAEGLYWARWALSEVEAIPFARGLARRCSLLTLFPGVVGSHDRLMVDEALRLVTDYGLGPEVRWQMLEARTNLLVYMGDIRRAQQTFEELRSLRPVSAEVTASVLSMQGLIEVAAGRLVHAQSCFDAGAVAIASLMRMPDPALMSADVLIARGELDAADRILTTHLPRAEQPGRAKNVLMTYARLFEARGDAQAALGAIRRIIHMESVLNSEDGGMDTSELLVSTIERTMSAERLSPSEVRSLRADLDVVQDLILSLSGSDGPSWYPIHSLILRARLLVLTPETLSQALTLDHQALDLARSTCADLLPETGSFYADNLLRAAKPDDAIAVIADVEPYAAQNGFLKERALLLADRVLALVQRGDAPAIIDPHLTALRAALAATDSPRITAETLRDLAIRLPPATTTPDPLALAEEVHPLFVAMPMPAEDARCLELMGDVLLARGRPEDAKRRYLTARARLQRYGLGLRLPLLDRKINALA